MSGAGLLLLSIVAGYWVLERAHTHEGSLKRIGMIVGTLVIVVAILGTACKIVSCASGGICARSSMGGYMCPIKSKMMPAGMGQ